MRCMHVLMWNAVGLYWQCLHCFHRVPGEQMPAMTEATRPWEDPVTLKTTFDYIPHPRRESNAEMFERVYGSPWEDYLSSMKRRN